MARVLNFPKRYTSYKVSYLPFPDSPLLHFTMQCPYDKLDEFLEHLFAMPPEEAYYFEVHGMLADGGVDVVRGDIKVDAPRGRISVRHTALIFPGSSMADSLRIASEGYIKEQREKMTAGVRRRNSLTTPTPAPAAPAKEEVKPVSLMDSNGKPRFTWDAQKAQYVEKATGHCITESQWAEMRKVREAAKLNRPLASTTPTASQVADELKKIMADVDDPLSVFPVVLTSIEVEEFK